MEVKLNNYIIKLALLIFVILIIPTFSYGQPEYNKVLLDSLKFGGISYGDNIDKVRNLLGKPLNYSEYEEEVAGRDKILYLTYDLFKISFYEWQNEIYMNSIRIQSDKYEVYLNNETKLKVGMYVTVLKNVFPISFAEYESRCQDKKRTQMNFYVYVGILYESKIYYEYVMNIAITDDKISSISISFDPA